MVTHQFLAVEAALDTDLERRLRVARKKGQSFRTIADELSQSGVYVNKEVCRKWCRSLGIE